MAGNVNGGLKARDKNLKLHGADFYQRIGRIGGLKKTPTGGFGHGEEGRKRAVEAGRKGGMNSKASWHKSKPFMVVNRHGNRIAIFSTIEAARAFRDEKPHLERKIVERYV